MNIQIREITPHEATTMLLGNVGNYRRLRAATVDKYAAEMSAGRWHMTGDPIVFTDDERFTTWGRLMQGQHRLHAIVKSGRNVPIVVITGGDPLAEDAMDAGLRRTLADVLSHHGHTSVHALAAVVNLSVKWQGGYVTQPTQPTYSEALGWVERNPSVPDAVRRANTIRSHIGGTPSVLGALLHQTAILDSEETDGFVTAVSLGENLAATDGAYAFRQWILNARTSKKNPRSVVFFAVAIKAWNHWVTGEPIRILGWRRGGANAEEFPELLDHDGNVVTLRDEKVA